MITNSKITAPNPQQMQSRKARLNVLIFFLGTIDYRNEMEFSIFFDQPQPRPDRDDSGG